MCPSDAREIQPMTARAMSAISASDSHFLVSHTEITRGELLARACTHDDAPCPSCLTGIGCEGPPAYSLWLPGDELEAAL